MHIFSIEDRFIIDNFLSSVITNPGEIFSVVRILYSQPFKTTTPRAYVCQGDKLLVFFKSAVPNKTSVSLFRSKNSSFRASWIFSIFCLYAFLSARSLKSSIIFSVVGLIGSPINIFTFLKALTINGILSASGNTASGTSSEDGGPWSVSR